MGKTRPYITVRVQALTPITTLVFVDHVYAVLLLQERMRSNRMHVQWRIYGIFWPGNRSGTAAAARDLS